MSTRATWILMIIVGLLAIAAVIIILTVQAKKNRDEGKEEGIGGFFLDIIAPGAGDTTPTPIPVETPGLKAGDYAKVVSDEGFFSSIGFGKIGIIKPSARLKVIENVSSAWTKIETNEYYYAGNQYLPFYYNTYKYAMPAKQGYVKTSALVKY